MMCTHPRLVKPCALLDLCTGSRRASISVEDCPFGKHPTIPNADSHASNESIEMSAEMELDGGQNLPGRAARSLDAFHAADGPQAGGPIQHQKRITGDLVCNMNRVRGKLLKARIAQWCASSSALSSP